MTFGPQPWCNRLELACEPSAVRWARLHARDILRGWGVPASVIDDALLVVSELTTNAVRHSLTQNQPPPWVLRTARVRRFALTLWCMPDHIQIYVHDEDRTPPVLHHPTADSPGGRGLQLVEELSDRWGFVYPTPDPSSGKAVWAKLVFPARPNPTDVTEMKQAVPPSRGPSDRYARNGSGISASSLTGPGGGVPRGSTPA
jgi:anti-sigma regulatory factor (Ser/Thr protein kinase)